MNDYLLTEKNEIDMASPYLQEETFTEIVRQYRILLLKIATQRTRNPSLAQDIVQDVFLNLWISRDKYTPEGSIRNYLITLTVNRCTDAYRKETCKCRYVKLYISATHGEFTSGVAESHAPEAAIVHRERQTVTDRILSCLPHAIQHVLILRYFEELSIKEISAVTDTPLNTVKSHLRRGLVLLRRTTVVRRKLDHPSDDNYNSLRNRVRSYRE